MAELERRIVAGWNINERIELAPLTMELPLTLALLENKLEVIHLLLSHGANINDRSRPAIVTAARNCDAETVELLVARGARIDACDNVGKNAYSAALYSERYDLLPVLARLGLHPNADGGSSLRQAVFARQFEAVQFFVEHGADVNAHVGDMVMPSGPTPVAVAARNGDFEMVRYLVEHGADVTIKDEYGDRPYLHAVSIGHEALQAYLKALEPPEWHSIEHRIAELRPFKLPAALLDFLLSDARRIEIGGRVVRFVQFHDVIGVKPIRLGRRRFLDLVAKVDNYWEVGFLAWSAGDRRLVHVSYEYGEITLLCTWPEFVANPTRWIDAVFE